MERPNSALGQRARSFNPEAATFNPGLSAPILHDTASGLATTAETLRLTSPMAPMFDHSPFTGLGSARLLNHRDSLTPAPVSLEDFFSPEVKILVKKLEAHPDVQEIQAPDTPKQRPIRATPAAAQSSLSLPPFALPARQHQPDYTTVDINELSAELGLPAAKTDTKDDVSPPTSYKSIVSQAHPGALYGKLIGRALDKPLTAQDLAGFLQSQDSHFPSTPPAPVANSANKTVVHQGMGIRDAPEINSIHKSDMLTDYRVAPPVYAQKLATPKGPSAYEHRTRRSSSSSTSYLHHARVPSNRRYTRRASRTKRIDQGPMPSAADIYPDDAHWTLSSPLYEAQGHAPYHEKPTEQPQIVIDNVFNWPPPAQAYKPEPAPTAADVNAADIDVIALMNELPAPSLDNIHALGDSYGLQAGTSFALSCDERALTPAQEDGSRYGVRFHGLAYGDQWELPTLGDFGKAEPFRIRPRNHDGWGGWEWAMRTGWAA
ncbi:hypothetical protein OPT61_g2576 [Boeremia exigua]|uniref:Uncharacterized protein n=1 Tax=Boeremia exigua TaxID=749465 RepID=A0ACC2IL99_9PLEO|nr:hypothetical protein OPT61_g2576 [Boeremia exigua]